MRKRNHLNVSNPCFAPDRTSMVSSRGADKVIMAKEGEESCPRCGGKVYSAEMMMAKDRVSDGGGWGSDGGRSTALR